MTETTRRRFLSFLGLGAAAAVAAPEVLKANPAIDMDALAAALQVPRRYLTGEGIATFALKPGAPVWPGDFVQLDSKGFVGTLLHDGERRIGQVLSAEPNEKGDGLVATIRLGVDDWDAES